MLKALACLLLFGLTACSQQWWIDRLASPEEQRTATQVATELRAGAIEQLTRRADPRIKEEVPRGAAQVHPMLERTKGAFSIKTVNVVHAYGGPITKTFVLQAGSGSAWGLVEVVLQGGPRSQKLAGFRVWSATSDPSKKNDFRVGDRGSTGYAWLLLMFANVALCLIAVVLIWRKPWLKRRWLWTLGSLLGVGAFGLNWSTGAWGLQPVNVSLLGAGATKAGPFAPWLLTFGVPVVAILVIFRWLSERRGQGSSS